MMNKPSKTMIQTGFRMSEELRDELQILADQEGRTFSNYVLRVLATHVGMRKNALQPPKDMEGGS